MGTYLPLKKRLPGKLPLIYMSVFVAVLFFIYLFLYRQNIHAVEISLTVLLIIVFAGFVILYLYMNQTEKYYLGLFNSGNDKIISYNNYEKFLRNANDMIIISDEKGDIKFMNIKALSVYGYSEEEVPKLNIKDIRYDSELFNLEEFRERVLNSKGYIFETSHKQKNGTVFPVEVSVQIIELEGEKYAQELIRNITGHKEAERKTAQLNRVYSVLSNVNQMIVRIKNKTELFKGACEIAVNDGGFKMAWIGIVDPLTKELKIESSGGSASQYLDNMKINLGQSGTLTGLIGKSMKSGLYEVCNDIEKEPLMVRSVEAAVKNNYHSVAAFPLKSLDKIIGFISLYSDRVNFFTQEEIKLLDEMAKDISYAVEFLDNEILRTITEKALKESQERMKVIVEGTPHLFFYVQDTEANIKYISPSVEKITGYGIEEWLRIKDWFITGSKINLKAIEATHAHLNGDFTENPVQLEINHAAGYPIFLEIFEYPIFNNGAIAGLQGVAHDITEKLKIEKELRESEEKYRSLVEGSPDGVFIVDFSGNFISANKAILNSMGFNGEELKHIKFMDLIPPRYHEMLKNRIQQMMAGKILDKPVEYEIIKKNGEKLFVEIHSVPFSKGGKVIGFQGIARDITEKKKAEKLLLQSEVEFRSVWESSKDAMRLCNENGLILRVNNAFCKLFERSENELAGEIYQVVYKYKDDASRLFKENVLAKRIIPKQVAEVELWNGKKKWLEISNSNFEINNSIMVLSIFRDISERKKYEVELQAAKENAEEANKTKDIFLANMSHELRTPLIGILGYSDMLAEVLSDTENMEMAKGITRSGRRLLNTLNLLLDLTKIESDKIDAEISIINIEDEIRFVFNTFKGIALEKKLDYSLQIFNDNLTAKVDPNMFRVILENLINNAVKFTNSGSISVIAGKEGDEKVFINVKDTGIGIDEKNFNKVFEEFRQVSEGTNREFQGTGLGLAIAKKYTEILNGTINIDSKLGAGSSFTIYFPAG